MVPLDPPHCWYLPSVQLINVKGWEFETEILKTYPWKLFVTELSVFGNEGVPNPSEIPRKPPKESSLVERSQGSFWKRDQIPFYGKNVGSCKKPIIQSVSFQNRSLNHTYLNQTAASKTAVAWRVQSCLLFSSAQDYPPENSHIPITEKATKKKSSKLTFKGVGDILKSYYKILLCSLNKKLRLANGKQETVKLNPFLRAAILVASNQGTISTIASVAMESAQPRRRCCKRSSSERRVYATQVSEPPKLGIKITFKKWKPIRIEWIWMICLFVWMSAAVFRGSEKLGKGHKNRNQDQLLELKQFTI